MRHYLRVVLLAAGACGDDSSATPDAAPIEVDAAPVHPTANTDREIIDTQLVVDVGSHASGATITFGASDAPGATLEVGDLMIDTVTSMGAPMEFEVAANKLNLALPPSAQNLSVSIAYHYKLHNNFDGVSLGDYTLVWPYYCGNMFPCHSEPADGTTFSLDITGVAAGKTAVHPATIPADAPSYQVAWAIDAYQELAVGTTTAGTQVAMWHRANELGKAQQGSRHLVAAVDWFEKTLGPYRFGPKVGGVAVSWGAGALGGMEHHPYWHVGSDALNSSETNVHEAAHGWYGDGIRIACWEDFLLSEGTVSYLAARALEIIEPAEGAGVWAEYEAEYNSFSGTEPSWPATCNRIDILADNLFSNVPYVRGAYFYRALAGKLGATMVDQVLAKFYMDYAGKSARMTDMLATIKAVTGYDAATCAEMFIRSPTKPAAGSACP